MKSSLLFLAAAAVFLLGLVSLGIGWKGTASVTVASPLSASSLQFCGSASGGWALAGISGIVLGTLLAAVALVSSIVRRAAQ
ncbi:MAG TPA: hypothetical protein VG204_01620 [Terriglobia bacterium]|nr:hypothetical protein [Terriglobia bacterium]